MMMGLVIGPDEDNNKLDADGFADSSAYVISSQSFLRKWDADVVDVLRNMAAHTCLVSAMKKIFYFMFF